MPPTIKRATIWFVQEPMADFNYANIEEFGNVVHLLRHLDRPALNPGQAIRAIRAQLMNWTDQDHFCAYGGDPLGILITGLVMDELWAGKPIRWLRWNRGRDEDGVRDMKNGFYQPMRFGLDANKVEPVEWGING